MVFVRATGRVILNVASLNTEGAVGNYNPLVKLNVMRRSDSGMEPIRVVGISGNMIKHWHAKATGELAGAENLCEDCRRGVYYRTKIEKNNESEYLRRCVLDDLHGFLHPETQLRRTSLCRFSFWIPAEEMDHEVDVVTHNRVVITKEGKIDKAGMMPFKQEYSSALYGFLISMDLKYIGVPQGNPYDREGSKLNIVLNNGQDRKDRARHAVMALNFLLSGEAGAKTSRALPVAHATDLILAISKKPLPNLVHGFFSDYAQASFEMLDGLLSAGYIEQGELKLFSSRDPPAISRIAIEKDVRTVHDIIAKAAQLAVDWL